MASGTIYFGTDQYRCTISNLPLFYIFNIYILNIFKKLITTWTLLWKYYKNIVNIIFLLLFCYTYLNFQVPSTNKWLITALFFFTFTHPLLLLQFIFLYFYHDFISSTCLHPLSLISFQISKSKSSPYLWSETSVITWAPKEKLKIFEKR